MLRRILILLLLCFPLVKVNATHIVGGEIYYDYLGNNNYQITLKIYRDCLNGQAPFDDPASIGIFDPVTNVLLQNLMVSSPVIVPISSSISVPCYAPAAGSVCEEEGTYTANVNLPPSADGYLIVYQRCCRNATIVNLVNPGAQGTTVTTYIPPPTVATNNNSPRFNYYPPIYLCQGVPFIFDHSATDPDGDLLVYSLCSPNQGADQVTPMPQPPNAPPYSSVIYQAPYNSNYQMATSPAISINANSGVITGTPTLQGTWVVAVCCSEYRNNQLINVSMRDFQFNVEMCNPIPVTGQISPNINAQATNCQGLSVLFTENSSNATNYYWNFGDPTTQNDTSNLQAAIYTYPANGTYTVTFIVNPGSICADTDSVAVTVTIPPTVAFTPPAAQCITGNNFNFQATGQFGNNATFAWQFGPYANPQTSNVIDPQNIVFDTSGTFPVTVTVTDNGCTATYTNNVTVYPEPEAHFSLTPVEGCMPLTVQFADQSVAGTPMTYSWYFGDGDSSNVANPSHTYQHTGVYDVTLIVHTSTGCISNDTLFAPGLVTVDTIPTAGIYATPTSTSIFNPFITVIDSSMNADSCWLDFGDGYGANECDGTHIYWEYGVYNIVQTVYNGYGCYDTAMVTIEIYPEDRFYIPNAFTPNGNGLNDIFMPAILGAENYHFMIFDRWGNLIFETNDVNVGWDGRYKGHKCEEDVYVWRITYTDVVDESERKVIGHVNLIR